jgi:hypothetical protein
VLPLTLATLAHPPQVVSHVYTTTYIRVKPHIMLSLILYKMVDEVAEVGAARIHLLSLTSIISTQVCW